MADAAKMLEGSAKLALESGRHPGALKDEVCSPAGTTIVGVRTLENFGLRAGMIAAIDETVAKSRSMSKK